MLHVWETPHYLVVSNLRPLEARSSAEEPRTTPVQGLEEEAEWAGFQAFYLFANAALLLTALDTGFWMWYHLKKEIPGKNGQEY